MDKVGDRARIIVQANPFVFYYFTNYLSHLGNELPDRDTKKEQRNTKRYQIESMSQNWEIMGALYNMSTGHWLKNKGV